MSNSVSSQRTEEKKRTTPVRSIDRIQGPLRAKEPARDRAAAQVVKRTEAPASALSVAERPVAENPVAPPPSPVAPPALFARADKASEILPARILESRTQRVARENRAAQLLEKLGYSGGSLKGALNEQVDALYDALESTGGARAELTGKALDLLVESGTLQKVDSRGKSVLEHLSARLGSPLASPLAAAGVDPLPQLADVVTALAYPGQIFQGKDTSTCVAASLETMLAKTDPGEYARIATGLLWEGQVELRGGQKVALSASEAGKDDEGRGLAHQVIQGSLRDHGLSLPGGRGPEASDGPGQAHGAPAESAAEGAETATEFGRGRWRRHAVYAGDSPTDGRGLTAQQASGLFSQVVGAKNIPFEVDGPDAEPALMMLEDALARVGAVSVGIRGEDDAGNPTYHQVTVDRIQDGTVYLADSGQGARIAIPVDEFKASLAVVIVPAAFIGAAAQATEQAARQPTPGAWLPDAWLSRMMRSQRRPRLRGAVRRRDRSYAELVRRLVMDAHARGGGNGGTPDRAGQPSPDPANRA